MPSWKKVIVSGSDASLSSLYTSGNITGSNILVTGTVSGSTFSGSFVGDASGLTGIALSGSMSSTGSFGELEVTTDLAQGTGFQNFTDNSMGAGADESLSGTLHLFDPSNTTFVKHFTSTANWLHDADISVNPYVAGYCNTTSAVNAVQFKMASGNIDAGTFKLYGIKDS